MSYRRGFVEKRHCTEDDKLAVTWKGMQFEIVTNDGKKIVLDEDVPPEGVYVEAGGKVLFKFVERRKEFAIGAVVNFTDRELTEILTMFVTEATTLAQRLRDWLTANGIPIQQKSTEDAAPAK